MAEVTQLPTAQPAGVIASMAQRFDMNAQAFEATIRATCMPRPKPGTSQREATREEFAAFLLVAKEYGLNPLTKEIYAFPAKGGGIVPVVSVDGWVHLINAHPQMDGVEFDIIEEKGSLQAITCRIYRKDRSRPVSVTESLAECIRDTDPWKMKYRMLRHKALIQCARYAFGFSGIYDEDEAREIAQATTSSVMPPPAPRVIPPSAPAQPRVTEQQTVEEVASTSTQEVGADAAAEAPTSDLDDEIPDWDKTTEAFLGMYAGVRTREEVIEVRAEVEKVIGMLNDEQKMHIAEAHRQAVQRTKPQEAVQDQPKDETPPAPVSAPAITDLREIKTTEQYEAWLEHLLLEEQDPDKINKLWFGTSELRDSLNPPPTPAQRKAWKDGKSKRLDELRGFA